MEMQGSPEGMSDVGSGLQPAERGMAGSSLSLSINDVPELADLAVGDTISFKLVNMTEDGTVELSAVSPGEPTEADMMMEGALGIENPPEEVPLGEGEAPNIEEAL